MGYFAFVADGAAQVLAPDFSEEIVFLSLAQPTNIEFSNDGRIFVAEKAGRVKVFDNLSDSTPTVAIDISQQVMDFWDRGLLGLALDSGFPQQPYVYVLYAYDAPLGQTAPVWNDTCADATTTGCQATGRLSRFQIDASNQVIGGEQVLISEQFCQQGPGHSLGDLEFGQDGALYVSAGEGAHSSSVDVGNIGNGSQSCPDPGDEGGAFRAQDIVTPWDPTTYDGAILRVDPATGRAMSDNPLVGVRAADDDPIVAFGLRNPFRFAVRPRTNELWIADVGWGNWEEINRVQHPTSSTLRNFGWPCLEAANQLGYYPLSLCQSAVNGANGLNASLAQPFYAYRHDGSLGGSDCARGASASISGVEFIDGGAYPSSYNGALVFSDFSRKCVWAMLPDGSGTPNPNSIVTLVAHPGASDFGPPGPVDLERGPNGGLFYVDLLGGTVRRLNYEGGDNPPPENQAPVARIEAELTQGMVPLTIGFDARASSDPNDGQSLRFTWDLDGDGQFDDNSDAQAWFTYRVPGSYNVRVRATDPFGMSAEASMMVTALGDEPPPAPQIRITSPTSDSRWAVADVIRVRAEVLASDPPPVEPLGVRWEVILHHCPGSACHVHTIQALEGVYELETFAPDHEYPSFLEFRVTVTDGLGRSVTESIDAMPETAMIELITDPPGLPVTVGPHRGDGPATIEVIRGSLNSVSAISPVTIEGVQYRFESWSNGRRQTHLVEVGEPFMSLTATYKRADEGELDAGVETDAGVGAGGNGGSGGGANLDGSGSSGCASMPGRAPAGTAYALMLVACCAFLRRRRSFGLEGAE